MSDLRKQLAAAEVGEQGTMQQVEATIRAEGEEVKQLKGEMKKMSFETASSATLATVAAASESSALEDQIKEKDETIKSKTAKISVLEENLSVEKATALEATQALEARDEDLRQAIIDAASLQAQLDRATVDLSDLEELYQVKIEESDDMLQEKRTKISVLQEELATAEVSSLEIKQHVQDLIGSHTIESEKASAEMKNLQDQIKTTERSLAEKSEEVTILDANVKSLETQLQETNEAFRNKLIEERGSRQDENRQLKNILSFKEKELRECNDKIDRAAVEERKMVATIDSMKLVIEASQVENNKAAAKQEAISKNLIEKENDATRCKDLVADLESKLESTKALVTETNASIMSVSQDRDRLATQLNDLTNAMEIRDEKMQSEFRIEIDDLVRKLKMSENEKSSYFEQIISDMDAEKELLKMDATSKLDVISDLITENNQWIQEVNDLASSKEETQLLLKLCKQEKMASDDRISELENDLEKCQVKYKKSMEALTEMEEVLLVVDNQRLKRDS